MKVLLKVKTFEEILARKNLSQAEFAKLVGATETYISMLKDNVSPSPRFRRKMLKVLNIGFDDLFFVENSCYSDNASLKGIGLTRVSSGRKSRPGASQRA